MGDDGGGPSPVGKQPKRLARRAAPDQAAAHMASTFDISGGETRVAVGAHAHRHIPRPQKVHARDHYHAHWSIADGGC